MTAARKRLLIVGAVLGVVLWARRPVAAAVIFKNGAGFVGAVPEPMVRAIDAVARVWSRFGRREVVITSANDSEHMAGSLHYRNLAIDVRLRDIPADIRAAMVAAVASELPEYTVILEDTGVVHMHIEYDQ